VGDGDRGPAGRALRPRRAGAVERRPASLIRLPGPRSDPGRGPAVTTPHENRRSSWSARLPGTALFTTMFREAAARALLLPRQTPGDGRRCGSSGNAARTFSRSPRVTQRSRSCSRPRARSFATCSTCRTEGGARRRSGPDDPRRPGRHPAVVPVRAVPAVPPGSRLHVRGGPHRWPSGVPPRSRSIGSSCASSSAPRTCAS
jgi:hypothetical protein